MNQPVEITVSQYPPTSLRSAVNNSVQKPELAREFSIQLSTLKEERFQALWQIFRIAGVSEMTSAPAQETRRRCLLLASMISNNQLPSFLFSSASLVDFTSYVDAFPKSGFIFQEILEREATFLIPDSPRFEIDMEEFMPSFHALFNNWRTLNFSGALTLGLFLLYIHRVICIMPHVSVNWGELVSTIANRFCLSACWR